MRRIELTMILAGGLAAAAPLAHAEDGDMQWTGSVSLGLRYSDVDARDASKFDEYRGLGDGASLWGGFEFRGRSDKGYFNVYTENLGTDNQYLDLRSGAYGQFKYRLYSDELRHRFGDGPGALSPFSGIGSNTLTMAAPPDTNTANWRGFDHSYTRRDKGGMAEWQATSPWYIRVDANEVKREGLNVFAGARGTSPGQGFSDLPAPIDYTTQNFLTEVGFTGERSHFAVNVGYSTFRNGSDVLRWNNAAFGNGYDTTVLPPDNQLTRLGMEGNLRGLFWNSTLAGRLVYSQLENNVNVQQSMLFTGGVFAPSNATPGTFNGDIARTNFALSLSSYPTRAVDTRLYVSYDKEDNKSTVMSFPGSPLSAGTCPSNPDCVPEMFHYTKTRVGAEGGIRTSRSNRFSGGVEVADTERERIDFDKTDETRVFAQWKNNSLDSLSTRVKYQYMTRDSEFNDTISLSSGNPMDFYVRRFDLANVDQNLLKLVLDVVPASAFDLGFEVTYKDNDYKDTILGRTKDQRQEYFASVGFGDPNAFRTFVFGDYEIVKFDSSHRVGTGNPDPATPPAGSTYNWTGKNEDKSWQFGLGTDWKIGPRFSIKGSLLFAKTEGSAEFTPEPGVVPALVPTPFLPINNVDNTRRTSLNLTGVYMVDRHWELTGGYAYERYEYDDIGYTGTLYVAPDTNANEVSPVTGQYSFQPYKANIVYGMAKYKF